MCGILGFNFKTNRNFLTLMEHRGPDNSAQLEVNNWIFGHNRLSIVDHNPLSNQPFVSNCGRYVIVFNGEVYNHNEIRKNLKDKYSFKTKSDTETILYNYIEKKEKCLNDFRGMFAFCIYDKQENKLFCARDRIGIKPFNYYFKNNKFIFASEINPIVELLETTPDINQIALRQYIKYLYIPYPNTIFKNIFKLPPSHYLIYEDNKLNIFKYWNICDYIGKNNFLEEKYILEKLDFLFDESIKLRMIADVELGSFLSGGIDSSLILYYMQKNSSKAVNTYTLGFADANKYDETNDARLIANYFKTNHNEIIIKPNVVSLLPDLIKSFGEPFASPTSLLIYELTKETKKLATVALAGDGGDEVFGGYPKYKAISIAERLNILPKNFWSGLNKIVSHIPEMSDGNHLPRRIKTFIGTMGKEIPKIYDEWSSYINESEIDMLFVEKINSPNIVEELWKELDFNNSTLISSIVDLKTYLPNDMLYYGDIASMMNSFEVRFPLIDHLIVEFITSINPKFRIKNGKTKYLMKKLLKNKIPDEIVNKKKKGLNPPLGIWLKKDLKALISEYLSFESINKRGIFNYEFIRKMIKEFNDNERDRSLNIWSIIVLEEWFRQYID